MISSLSKMAENDSKIDLLSEFTQKLRKNHFDEDFKKEMLEKFQELVLDHDAARKWGFPFVDDSGNVKCLLNTFNQDNVCRCGMILDLNKENWHIASQGCVFHPGKCFYTEQGHENLFSCCRQKSNSAGCIRRDCHVSSTRPCVSEDFVTTVKRDRSFLPSLPNIFALDCEMVYTTIGMEVVKVTVLSVFCDVVYDTFVKPTHPVIDYNTKFSGVEASHLADVTVDLKDVQSILLQLFDADTILVGHGLENDLLSLHLLHKTVIDTSILFPCGKSFPYRSSLKYLAKTYLGKNIRCNSSGHDSKEDAKTCMELMAIKIFSTNCRKNNAVKSYLSKIFQRPANTVSGRFVSKCIRFPASGYSPIIYTSYSCMITGVIPAYLVTNSVNYPWPAVSYHPPYGHYF